MSDSYTEIKYTAPPQSRNEAILAATVDGTQYTDPPQSRVEDLLLQVKEKIEQSGGTSDYTDLTNKPQINGTTLTGDKSSTDLDLQAEITVNSKLSSDLVDDTNATNLFVTSSEKTTWNGKQNSLSFDPTPTDGSTNPVESNGIYDALADKVDKVQGKGLSTEDFTAMYKTWLDVSMQSPLNHNGVYRGKDLTNVYTINEMYNMIHAGTFDDLFLGDYFTKSITTDIMTRFTGETFESGVDYYEMGGGTDVTARTWTLTEDTEPQSGKTYATKQTKTESISLMIAAFDYYYNCGDTDTVLTTHHIVLIPRGYGFATAAKMNETNTTTGGYLNSYMHQTVLPCYADSLRTALNNHLLSHRTVLSNAVNTSTPSMAGAGMTGAASGWDWTTVELQLMNEVQVYGTTVWSSSAYDVGVDNRQLPVFKFINPLQFDRISFWFRSVVSSTNFAFCGNTGYATYGGASGANYVRPLILFG